jgi:ATP-dependent DNA helicase PIF1
LIPKSDDPIKAIVESTYPNLSNNFSNGQYLESRAILVSTIETVDEINNYIFGLMSGNILYISL